jgi:hypothetical protein
LLLHYTITYNASFIALQKSNGLYLVAGSAYGASVRRVSHLTTKSQLMSELWHQYLGHPGPSQLSLLSNHSNGLPSQLIAGLHPMHSCQACNKGKIHRAPMGPNSEMATRFHLDFGFIRASSADFGVSMGNRVVASYDGNNTYLLIVCVNMRHTWIFCQASKSPPIFIFEHFLELNGLKKGPRFLHMDQGGELWRSNKLREVAVAASEPTGSNATYENSKIERPNSTFDAMVHCLLYSAGLSAMFWSAVLVHAVYLKNRLYHKALCHTPTKLGPEKSHHWSRYANRKKNLPRLIDILIMESY